MNLDTYLKPKKHFPTNLMPPAKWCKYPEVHTVHLFEHRTGLIYTCHGTKAK